MNTKLFYETDKGLRFKTILPVKAEETEVKDFISYHYSGIKILSFKPTKKTKYAHFCNIRIKN